MTERDAIRNLVEFARTDKGDYLDETREAVRVVLGAVKRRELEAKTIQEALERISAKIEEKIPAPRQQEFFRDQPKHPDL